MKKSSIMFLFIFFVSLTFTAYSVFAATTAKRASSGNMTSMNGPTRTITQEMGGVIKEDDVNVDLTALDGTGYYQPGGTQAYIPTVQINMGIWGGELRVGGGYGTEKIRSTGSLGYKLVLGPGAGYGRVNFNRVSPSANPPQTKTGDVDLTLGYAFSQDLKSLIVNLNGELTIDSDYSDTGTVSNNQSTTDFKLNGAILLPLIPKLTFVGELGFDTNNNPNKLSNGNSASAIVIGLGARLNPNSRVTVDGMILSYASLSGSGRPYDSISGFGTPVVLRANYQF